MSTSKRQLAKLDDTTPLAGRRFFNVTIIDEQGAPTFTQLWISNFGDATLAVHDRATRISKHQPMIIGAFIFDTAERELRTYRVDADGFVVEGAI